MRSRRRIEAVDTTAAGDTFTAALTVALVEGQGPEEALQFACAAGAAAATKARCSAELADSRRSARHAVGSRLSSRGTWHGQRSTIQL